MSTVALLAVIDSVLVVNVIACWHIMRGVKRRGK